MQKSKFLQIYFSEKKICKNLIKENNSTQKYDIISHIGVGKISLQKNSENYKNSHFANVGKILSHMFIVEWKKIERNNNCRQQKQLK